MNQELKISDGDDVWIKDGPELRLDDETLVVEIMYPRSYKIKAVEVSLSDVRAADSLRVDYDFGRDGWSITQASRFCWAENEPIDSDWKEVAFIKAWARLETEEQANARMDKFKQNGM